MTIQILNPHIIILSIGLWAVVVGLTIAIFIEIRKAIRKVNDK